MIIRKNNYFITVVKKVTYSSTFYYVNLVLNQLVFSIENVNKEDLPLSHCTSLQFENKHRDSKENCNYWCWFAGLRLLKI
jgi:hypothetical protein